MNGVVDHPVDDTWYLYFPTYDSNGASVTVTGLAVTDVEIFVDGSPTTRSSDNGYTLLDTDGVDFAGIVGIHGISVDSSNNSDAGFYAAGSHYLIAVDAITVDGQTVRFFWERTIGKSLHPTTAGRTLTVSANGEGNADLTFIHGTALTETPGQLAAAFVKLLDVATPLLVASDVMRGTNSAALASVWTVARAGVLTDWINGGRLDLILDIIAADTTTDIPALIAALNNLSQANIRTAVGLATANIDTQLADIPTVAEMNARTLVAANYGTAANQTTIVGNLGTITAHLTDIKGATFSGDTHSLVAIRGRGDTAWVTATVSALALEATVVALNNV
ncbi:hypothetical protein LCGC14_2723630, partial [marine sediment metagenome]